MSFNKEKLGWLLFFLCSLIYMLDSIINGNSIMFVGGLLFFLGCVMFMLPEKKAND